jgi:subtilase family serine protease
LARTLLVALVGALALATAATAASPRPDLGIVKVAPAAYEVATGGKLTIKDKIGNAGKATAKPSQVGYYLSVDALKSAGDILLGHRSVGRLRAGKAAAGSVALTAPNAVGLFRVIACADDKRRVKESHESNNCRAIARDLRISAAR